MRQVTVIIHKSGIGEIGFIINRDYLDGITKRIMRSWLNQNFPYSWQLDLNGDARGNVRDENVFDILQGVSIALFSSGQADARYISLQGTRAEKYNHLLDDNLRKKSQQVHPAPPLFRFAAQTEKGDLRTAEFQRFYPINEVFPAYSS